LSEIKRKLLLLPAQYVVAIIISKFSGSGLAGMALAELATKGFQS
jgi:hypothetical protein